MMNHFPYSYEQELKEQVAERLGAIERIRRADRFERERSSKYMSLAGSLGRLLVRLGTRLEQPRRTLDHIAGYAAEQRG
jgi:hypothetical protein